MCVRKQNYDKGVKFVVKSDVTNNVIQKTKMNLLKYSLYDQILSIWKIEQCESRSLLMALSTWGTTTIIILLTHYVCEKVKL